MKENKRKSTYNYEADAKWIDKNTEHKRYLSARSAARSFINKKATDEDLEELETLIAIKRIKNKPNLNK